jgi:hypothetical protein
MKNLIIFGAALLVLAGISAYAEELKVGMPASDWTFEDADGKVYTMESWAGKVLLVNYVDPDEADLNEHFSDAMKKAKEEGRLKDETYKGIGIADCAATWKPNFAIRVIAGKKAEKFKTVILFDYDAKLRNAWGLQKDTANDDQVEKLVQLAVDLQ